MKKGQVMRIITKITKPLCIAAMNRDIDDGLLFDEIQARSN